MTNSSTQLAILSDPAEVPVLQDRLLSLCSDAGLDDLAAFQLTCAIVEAVNNCIEHAYGGEPGHPISLLWRRSPDAVTVEIRDQGRSMPTSPMETSAIPEVNAESGRGWHIIHEWTDAATYTTEADSNLLTLTRRLS